jgi:2-aminoadipate transaminase
MIDFTDRLSRAATRMQESEIRRVGTVAARVADLISLAPGYPDHTLFAWDDYRAIATDVLSSGDARVLQYGPTRGYRPLLESLVGVMQHRSVSATTEELLVTTGSQQGLDLVARLFLDPGDVALMELPTYTGAIIAFRNALGTLVGVRRGTDGIDLDHLDWVLMQQRAQGRQVAFLYLTPNFQNPTGFLLSRHQRLALVDWATRRNVLIVEDDPYGVLYFEDSAAEADTRPIKADDVEGRVIYLSTFSKTLAPGFRVAWLVAPAAVMGKFEAAKQAMDLCTGGLDQRIVHEAIVRGVLTRQIPGLRLQYQRKRDAMERALALELPEARWVRPKGGFFIWLELPRDVDGEALLTTAIEQRILYVAGAPFFVEAPSRHFIRLAFSGTSPARIAEGIARLARAVRAERGARLGSSAGVPGSAISSSPQRPE